MFQKFYFLLFIFFVIISCNDNDNDNSCHPTKVDIIEVNKNRNCDDFKFNLKNIDYAEIKIINNFNDYNYYVSDNCDINIDFNLYTVILGHFSREKKIDSIEYDMYFLPCSANNDYYLNIIIKEVNEELNTLPNTENEFLLITSKFDIKPVIISYSIKPKD